MLEKQIEAKVCTYARSLGFLHYKFVSPSQRAVPDRVFISPTGSVVFIEFKQEGKKATPAQEACHEQMRRNNAVVWVCSSVAVGKDIINCYK